jgi:hypothetical protein
VDAQRVPLRRREEKKRAGEVPVKIGIGNPEAFLYPIPIIYIGYIGYIGYLYIYPIYRPLKYLKKVAICGAMCRFWDPPSTEKEATYRFDHQ